jgi:hypothetical protein
MDPATENTDKKILSPFQWMLSASALFALVIVPLTVGLFYMTNLTNLVAGLPLQYNVVVGLFVGILLSVALGVFYAGIARKHAE